MSTSWSGETKMVIGTCITVRMRLYQYIRIFKYIYIYYIHIYVVSMCMLYVYLYAYMHTSMIKYALWVTTAHFIDQPTSKMKYLLCSQNVLQFPDHSPTQLLACELADCTRPPTEATHSRLVTLHDHWICILCQAHHDHRKHMGEYLVYIIQYYPYIK